MDASYIANYRELYEHHWWWRSRAEVVSQTLARWVARDPAQVILDIGCGDGLMFDELTSFGDVHGIEADPLAVTPNGRWSSKIHQGPFDDSYQTTQQFDLITMLDVLEHLPDAPAALRRIQTLLKPTGILVLTVPALQMLWTSHDDINHHYIRYRKGSLHPILRQAGLRIVESRYLFYWTCPVKLAIRIKEGIIGHRPKTPQVPRRWLNQILKQFSRCEERLSRHIPVPFGSSLLVVAQPDLLSDQAKP